MRMEGLVKIMAMLLPAQRAQQDAQQQILSRAGMCGASQAAAQLGGGNTAHAQTDRRASACGGSRAACGSYPIVGH